jgi:hypothetical protein
VIRFDASKAISEPLYLAVGSFEPLQFVLFFPMQISEVGLQMLNINERCDSRINIGQRRYTKLLWNATKQANALIP